MRTYHPAPYRSEVIQAIAALLEALAVQPGRAIKLPAFEAARARVIPGSVLLLEDTVETGIAELGTDLQTISLHTMNDRRARCLVSSARALLTGYGILAGVEEVRVRHTWARQDTGRVVSRWVQWGTEDKAIQVLKCEACGAFREMLRVGKPTGDRMRDRFTFHYMMPSGDVVDAGDRHRSAERSDPRLACRVRKLERIITS